MQNGFICFFVQQNLEPFCFHPSNNPSKPLLLPYVPSSRLSITWFSEIKIDIELFWVVEITV